MSCSRFLTVAAAVLAGLAFQGCSREKTSETKEPPSKKSAPEETPEKFRVEFETTKGSFVVEAVRSWAPHGVDRFYELVTRGFFEDSALYRVLPKFVVQFGINKDPEVSKLWAQLKLRDDPVKESNKRGYLSYAKTVPNSRTTQIFINMADNSRRLDSTGFAPFARVVEGMEVVEKFFDLYGESATLGGSGPDARKIEAMGNEYLKRNFPRLDYIKSAKLVPIDGAGDAEDKSTIPEETRPARRPGS
ncbi:MAG: peptidylprolyl isomerase [Bryobacteraceae bacterium]